MRVDISTLVGCRSFKIPFDNKTNKDDNVCWCLLRDQLRWQHNWQKGTLWKRRRTSRHLLLLTRITGGKYETRPKKNLRSSEFPLSLALTIRHLKKGYTRWDWHVEEYCLKTLSAQGLQYWSTRETLTRLGHSAQLTSKWFRAISNNVPSSSWRLLPQYF